MKSTRADEKSAANRSRRHRPSNRTINCICNLNFNDMNYFSNKSALSSTTTRSQSFQFQSSSCGSWGSNASADPCACVPTNSCENFANSRLLIYWAIDWIVIETETDKLRENPAGGEGAPLFGSNVFLKDQFLSFIMISLEERRGVSIPLMVDRVSPQTPSKLRNGSSTQHRRSLKCKPLEWIRQSHCSRESRLRRTSIAIGMPSSMLSGNDNCEMPSIVTGELIDCAASN